MNPLVIAFVGWMALLGLLVFACMAWRLVALRKGPIAIRRASTEPIYETTSALLTPAERSFFGVLQQVVLPSICLFPKVRLADVIQPRSALDGPTRQSAFNKISSKHVDFVLCDAGTTKVICVIELDDSSHGRGSRQARDSFVDAALQFASIPVVRFSVRHGYAPEKIRVELAKAGLLVCCQQTKRIPHPCGRDVVPNRQKCAMHADEPAF